MPQSKYILAPQVLRVMAETAITMDELEVMITRAAIISDIRGNRRYHNWLMWVDGINVLFLCKLHMTQIGHGHNMAEEECQECEGEGCIDCGWVGLVERHFDT